MSTKLDRFLPFHPSKRFACILTAACFLLLNLACCYQLSRGAKNEVAIGGLFAFCLLICYLVVSSTKTKSFFTEERSFALLLVTLGCFYLIVFPPFSVPDELYHFKNTYSYSNLLLLSNLSYIRPEDAQLFSDLSTHLSNNLYETICEKFSVFPQSPDEESVTSILNSTATSWNELIKSTPQVRICGALGIAIGRLLNLGAIPVLYLGRLFNFALFVALAYWAIRITPVGKRIFMMVCFLPMTLHLAASYSYDAGIIGMAFLLIACFLNAMYSPKQLSKKRLVLLAALSVLLAPCKIIYTTIVFMIFLVPKDKFPNARFSICYKFGVLGVSLLSAVSARLIPSLFSSGEASTSAATSNYTISNIMSDPVDFIGIIIRTCNVWGDNWLRGVLGGDLGWFQVSQPWFTLIGFFILLLLAIPTYKEKRFDINGIQRFFFAVIPIISFFLIIAVMYISWTPNTETTVQGVQGRYFLPTLPLMLLALKGNILIAEQSYTRSLIFAASVLNIAYVTRMFAVILVQ